MHCPTCRADNAASTRFCTSCGAVLVEEAPGGGRRRVLRPWGLRRSAPLTVAPDFPDRAPMPAAGDERMPRVGVWLAGGVAAIVVVVATVPWLRRNETTSTSRADERVVAAPAVVVAPLGALVMETRLAAPALVERAPGQPRAAAVAPQAAASSAELATPRLGGSRGVPALPVAYAMTQRDAVVRDGESADPAPPASTAPPPEPTARPDRLLALHAELHGCEPLGLFERATCEQRARLLHCEGHWGHVAACPHGRTEYAR